MPRIETLAVAGAALSAYALYVEYRHEHEVEGESPFVALCDIDVIGASCRYVHDSLDLLRTDVFIYV